MHTFCALLAFIACALLGINAARRLQEREKLLRHWEAALQRMALIAAHAPAALPDLLRRGAGEHLPLLAQAAHWLDEAPALSPDALWARLPAQPLLAQTETEIIRDCIRALFSPELPIQQQALACAGEQFARFHEISLKSLEKNSRLYGSLGYLAGAALFILIC